MTAYTSDLSIDEALLLEEVGFEPLSFVVGSSHYHVGYQLAAWSKNQELTPLTAAMGQARLNAMHRLSQQAVAAGAHGVVGVRLDVEHEGHTALFSAMGTAVRAREGDWRVTDAKGAKRPFTSDLSGQDFWALVRGGYRPCELVMGNCVYHVAHQGLGSWMSRVGQNCEMPTFTQALYDARELAMARMQTEARACGGTGVVGMTLSEGSYGWHPHIIEYQAVGTAIAPRGVAAEHEPVMAVLSASP